jgi:hypothetical protein
MPHLELSDGEADALAKELHAIIESDRCRLGSKLRAILHKLRPEPVRWARPPQPWADLYCGCFTFGRAARTCF